MAVSMLLLVVEKAVEFQLRLEEERPEQVAEKTSRKVVVMGLRMELEHR